MRLRSSFAGRLGLIIFLLAGIVLRPQFDAYAAASLTITPITWNVVGLDSNNVTVGPSNFPVGARVCNTGDATANNLIVDFVWDDGLNDYTGDPYINLRSGSYSSISVPSLAAVTCKDFYFEISVARSAAAYNMSRDYHITADSNETALVSTPTPREIFVEHLVSQNRNSVTDVKLDGVSIAAGGTMNLMVGSTYTIQLVAATATNGYEQIESFINFPNTIFQVNSVVATYSAFPTPHTDPDWASKLYADGCGWVNDPNDIVAPAYRECTGAGKYGGNITISYNVTIIGGGGTNQILSTLIYDFSGSSYHYNSDFGSSSRIASITTPSACIDANRVSIATWNFNDQNTIVDTINGMSGVMNTGAGVTTAAYLLRSAGNYAHRSGNWSTVTPNQEYLEFVVSTLGFTGIKLSFDAAQDNNAGPDNVAIQYSTDGTNFTTSLTSDPLSTTFAAVTSDMSSVVALENNSSAEFRLVGTGATQDSRFLQLDNVTVSGCPLPQGLSLSKSASPDLYAAPGQAITYTYTLTNTGLVPLRSPFDIVDDKEPAVMVSCAGATSPLEPGVSTTCTGAYTTTAADVTALSVTNTATATGTFNGASVGSNTTSATIAYPALNIIKEVSADNSTWSDTSVTVNAGSPVYYRISVDNTGGANLTGVTVEEDMASCTLSGPTGDTDADNILDPSEIWIYTCTVTALAGTHNNTATADSAETGPDSDTASYSGNVPSLNVEKASTTTAITAAGQVVPYTFTLTNTGNVSLTGITVSDPRCDAAPALQSGDTNSDSQLQITETWLYTCNHTVSQLEVDAGGNLGNTVTADSVESDPDTASLSIPVTQTPAITLAKNSNATSTNAVADLITYTYDVRNTGNVTLTSVTVTDAHSGLSALTCTPAQGSSLLPDASMSCTATYTVTQNDVDAGSIENTGIVTGTPPTGPAVTATSLLSEPVAQTPGLKIVKEVSVSDAGPWNDTSVSLPVGDPVHYRLLVSNTGNVTLTGITVDDGMTGCTLLGPAGDADADNKLDVNEIWAYTCSVSTILGRHTNTATADSDQTVPVTDDADYVGVQPDLTVTKTNDVNGSFAENNSFQWTITVLNSGTGDAIFAGGQTILSDSLPAGATYNPVLLMGGGVFSQLECAIISGTLICSVTPGGGVTFNPGGGFSVTLTASPTAPGTLSNTATVDPDSEVVESNEANNSASDDVLIVDVPEAIDDNATTNEGVSVTTGVLTNDDLGTEPTTITSNTQGADGTVTCTPTDCTYTPGAGFTGTDSYTYTIADANGNADTATVVVTVVDLPYAVDDADTTNEGVSVTTSVLLNDDLGAEPTIITSNTQGAHGTVSCTATQCTYSPDPGFSGTDAYTYTITDDNGNKDVATVTITIINLPQALNDSDVTNESTPVTTDVLTNDDLGTQPTTITSNTQGTNGTVGCTMIECTYTPNAGFTGTDTYAYTITDDNGNSDTATVTIIVIDLPDALDDVATTNENTAVTTAVLTNDDLGVRPTTITSNTQGTNGTVTCTATDCIYTPNAGFSGTDTYTYTITDDNDNTDTATVTVVIINLPDAIDDNATTNEGAPVTTSVLTNDDLGTQPSTITANTQGANGTVTCTATDCTYTPKVGFTGTDTYTYTITDANGNTDTATVTVTVTNLPDAVNDNAITNEGSAITTSVLTNDDLGTEPTTITSNTPGTNGIVTCTVIACTYTPDPGFTGTDTYTYTITDDNGNTSAATVTVLVIDLPDAADDSATTNEGISVTTPVLTNDDPGTGPTTITSNTQGTNGAVTCTATDCTYDPDPGFSGTDSYTYTITDANGNSDTATVTVTIVNLPDASNDMTTTNEGTPVKTSVLSNDDLGTGPTTITSYTQGTNGTVTCTATECTYTPAVGFSGSDTYTYTITDANGNIDTATVTITVINLPDAVDDSDATNQDIPVATSVLTNDDLGTEPAPITANTQGANGTVSCTVTECEYTPNAGYSGTDSYTYTITDANGNSDTATVTIMVVNLPEAVNDSASTNGSTPVTTSVLVNDDLGTEPTMITANSQGTNGTVTCTATQCTYTPASGFSGTDSYTYTITDDNGNSSTATVTVAVADMPLAVNDSDETDEGSPITTSVLKNDDLGTEPTTITATSQGASGAVSCTATECTYTPDPGFSGLDTYTYTITDKNANTSTATVTITVRNLPGAVDDNDSTEEGQPVSTSVLANDDLGTEPTTITSNTQGAHGAVSCSALDCTYAPALGFSGTDTYTYTIIDANGNTSTATVTVTVVNLPDAVDNSDTTEEGVPVTTSVLLNDDLGTEPTTITSNAQGANGSVACTATQCTYAPNAGFSGIDSYTYTITDASGNSDTATVTLTIIDLPDATNDSATTNEGVPITTSVLGNDDLGIEPTTITSNTQGTNGTVSCTATACTYSPGLGFSGTDTYTYIITDSNGNSSTATVTVTVIDLPDASDDSTTTNESAPVTTSVLTNDDLGTGPTTITANTQGTNGSVSCTATQCTYSSNAGFSGTDAYTYTITDNNGNASTATVTVTVIDLPEAVNDLDTTDEGSSITTLVLANDDLGTEPTTITFNTQGANGTVSCTATQCTYTPDIAFQGSDTYTYTITDSNGNTSTATVTITVVDLPDALNDSDTIDEGMPVTTDVLANDDLGTPPTAITSNTQGANGTVSCTATQCTYTPNAGFSGTDTYTYTITDANGATDTATVTITVMDLPDAADDSATTDEAAPVTTSALSNDDLGTEPTVITSNTQGSNGAVACTATQCTYTPNAGFTGTDSYTYTITDDRGNTDTATITITVRNMPVALADTASTMEGSPVTTSVLSNDDLGTGPTTITSNTQGANGSVSCTASACTYSPAPGFSGTDTYSYTVTDSNGNTSTATVTITVVDLPDAIDDSDTTDQIMPVATDVLSNDDLGTEPTTITGNSQGTNGTVNCTATTCTYTPVAGFSGVDAYTYTITDNNGNSDTATVTITVRANPRLVVVKEVSASSNGPWNDKMITVTSGETVYYRVRVSNTGNVTLTGLTVNDAQCSLIRGADLTGNDDNTFETGEEWTYGCSLTAILGTNSNTVFADTNETPPSDDTASYNATAALVVDPAISKAGDPAQASVGETVTFTLVATNEGNAPAPNVVVTDALPAMFDVSAVNVTGAPLGTLVNVTPPIGTGVAPYTVVVTLGGDLGVNDVVTIQIATTVNGMGTPPITNTASLTSSAATDIAANNSASVTITLRDSAGKTKINLPATGFAQDKSTLLPQQPAELAYAATDVVLEVPSLGVKIPIVGIPKKNGTWNVSWLGDQAGWLQGSAFPSWNGNSLLTSHVYLSNGLPGPFVNLNKLKYGDQIIVHAYGQKYIFAVQSNTIVEPTDGSVMKHEEKPWLTLITCKEYDQKTNSYKKRVVVRAILVSVQ